jgi:hypothetical protein
MIIVHKSNIGKILTEDHAHDKTASPHRVEIGVAVPIEHLAICNNKGNRTLSMKMYSARLTRHKPEIKKHQGSCKADIKWASWTFLRKSISTINKPFPSFSKSL